MVLPNLLTDNKYGTFPSAAIGWRIKNESFLKDVTFLDDLKLRASWGRVGNQSPIGLFQYQACLLETFPANYNGSGIDNFGYPFNKVYQNRVRANSTRQSHSEMGNRQTN